MVVRLALLGALLLTAGCAASGSAAPQGFTVGSTVHAMTFGGLDRAYRLYIPDGLSAPAPLVVMLHGGFGSARPKRRTGGTNWRTARNSSSPTPTVSGARGIYATGISNGGMMAFALACNTATFAAIGTDSATQLDQCAPPVVSTDGPVTTSTAGCADGRGVVLITVDGGGHQWPTFATQRLWDFFSAHPA